MVLSFKMLMLIVFCMVCVVLICILFFELVVLGGLWLFLFIFLLVEGFLLVCFVIEFICVVCLLWEKVDFVDLVVFYIRFFLEDFVLLEDVGWLVFCE